MVWNPPVSLSLLVCMYVSARNILSQSCSLCLYVHIGLPGPAHPPKVKYSLRSDQLQCLFPCLYKQREYFTLGGCAGLGRPIHTYEQREQQLWDRIFLANKCIHTSKERTSKPQSHSFTALIYICREIWTVSGNQLLDIVKIHWIQWKPFRENSSAFGAVIRHNYVPHSIVTRFCKIRQAKARMKQYFSEKIIKNLDLSGVQTDRYLWKQYLSAVQSTRSVINKGQNYKLWTSKAQYHDYLITMYRLLSGVMDFNGHQ